MGSALETSVLALKEKGAVDAYASPKVGGKLLMIHVSHTMKNISELVSDSPPGNLKMRSWRKRLVRANETWLNWTTSRGCLGKE